MSARWHHLDKTTHHHLASGEVGYHAILQRAYSPDAVIGLLVHTLGRLTYSYHLIGVAVYCYDGRLVNDYFIILHDDSVGRTKVHRYFSCERKKSHLNFLILKLISS